MPMRVAAFGRTHWLYDSIRAVAARGHEIAVIGTTRAMPEYTRTEADFQRLADELLCPCFVDSRLESPEISTLLGDARADVAISINWPGLVRTPTLTRFAHGVINAHCGDLPRYRGNAAPNWAILQNEPRVVVTLHRMVEDLDAGPILAQQNVVLNEDTYIGDVYAEISHLLPGMFADLIDALASGRAVERAQDADPAASLRCLPRRPGDALLDWRQPASALARLVRASAEPFAGAYSFHEGELLRIWRAKAGHFDAPHLGVAGQVLSVDSETGEVAVLCGDGMLGLSEVEREGAGRQRAADVIRSTRDRLGSAVEDELYALRRRVEQVESMVSRRSRGDAAQ